MTQNSDIPSYHATKLNSAQVISNSKLKVIFLNCQSIRSQEKRASLEGLAHEHSPDVIVGCESHLDSTYTSSEVFPSGYTVIRRDCSLGGGGVFLCFREALPVVEQPLLSSDAEAVWAKLTFIRMSPIYICSFYRPPNTDTTPLTQLQTTLYGLQLTHLSPNIIIAGDFNLPSIMWSDTGASITPSPAYGRELNSLFWRLLMIMV